MVAPEADRGIWLGQLQRHKGLVQVVAAERFLVAHLAKLELPAVLLAAFRPSNLVNRPGESTEEGLGVAELPPHRERFPQGTLDRDANLVGLQGNGGLSGRLW